MRNCIFIFALILEFSLVSNATIRTVNNLPSSAGQYTSAQAAVDASNPNDTIYIHASPASYGNLVIDRPLCIMGEGARTTQQNLYPTMVENLHLVFNSNNTSSASGSKIIGLKIVSGLYLGANHSVQIGTVTGSPLYNGVSNVYFFRNEIGSSLVSSNLNPDPLNNGYRLYSQLVFVQNVIGSFITPERFSNCVFFNNIIYSGINQGNNMDATFDGGHIIKNNLIGGDVSLIGSIVQDNILYRSAYPTWFTFYSLRGVSYSNNLFRFSVYWDYSGQEATVASMGTNLASNVEHFVNMSPNVDIATQMLSGADFHLLTTSPGINMSSTGGQVGIYGGPFPWVDGDVSYGLNYRYFPMPNALPIVKELTITNPMVTPTGVLNIQFKAHSQE